jgi:valyl-tRNA synthetase
MNTTLTDNFISFSELPKNEYNELAQKYLAELNELINGVTININKYEFNLAADKLYHFIWHSFADVYIEQLFKNEITDTGINDQNSQKYYDLLINSYRVMLELLHPFMPFITEELWQKLPHQGESIMITSWPTTK